MFKEEKKPLHPLRPTPYPEYVGLQIRITRTSKIRRDECQEPVEEPIGSRGPSKDLWHVHAMET